MIKVKTFTSVLKIFHTRHELDELDAAVNDFIAAAGVRSVVSVSDAVTTGEKGEAIGIVRVVAYEEKPRESRETYQEKLEAKARDWGREVDRIRDKADKLGAEAKAKLQEQVAELQIRQEEARRRVQELKKSGGDAWEDLRKGTEAALDELKKGVESALAKLRKTQ